MTRRVPRWRGSVEPAPGASRRRSRQRVSHPSPAGRHRCDTVDGGITVALLLLGYRLLHRALRARVVERVVVASSLTHFAWWRRYRAPRQR